MQPPQAVEVRIEVPRGGLIKWGSDGRVRYVSPVPSPYNYGSVPGVLAEDGDPLDAVVLGRRLPRGHVAVHDVLGVVRFVDAGLRDDKLVCGRRLSRGRIVRLLAFFHLYASIKRAANLARGRPGPTACEGFEPVFPDA